MLPTVCFGFPHPRPDASESSGGFSSPKLEPPDPTEVIYKSGEIKLKSEEIQRVLNHIWWDLARSGHSQQILAILVQILAILMQIWFVFIFSSNDFANSSDDFAAPATTRNRPNILDLHPNPKPTQSIEADGRFRVTLLSTQRWRVGFKLGQKPTQPNPWTLLNIIAWLMLYYKVKRGLI